jgi:hypothetical protein
MDKHFVEAEELQGYLDHELDPTRQGEVQRHVVHCEECSAMIADLKRVSTTLQRWEVAAPSNLRPPLIREEKRERGFSWMRLALGLSGAVFAVLIIAAISIPNLLRSRIASDRASEAARDRDMMTFQVAPPETVQGGGSGAPGESSDQVRVYRKIAPLAAPRMISYQVSMTLEVKEFDQAKNRLREIMDTQGGYMAQANFVETPNQPKRANLVLRVPAVKLATILNQVRELGRVREEHLNSEEVTEQVVDLEARLKNARSSEQRLIEVLNNRTGKVGDILQVEQEIARTRELIERMEAQRQNLMKRVEMANVTLTLMEEFKAELQPAPVGTLRQLWNATVDGYESFTGSVLGLVLFVARYGLTLAFWGGLCWATWRLVRRPLKRLVHSGE